MTQRRYFVPKSGKSGAAEGLFDRMGITGGMPQIAEQIRTGLPVETVDRLTAELEIPLAELLGLIHLAPATLSRRRSAVTAGRGKTMATKAGQAPRLTATESDRVWRLAKVVQLTEQLFEGDVKAAREWLKRPARALGGVAPLATLDTQAGADAVVDLIGRLEHGVFA